MTRDYTLLVGTTGSGVFQSSDSGVTWSQSKMPIPYGPWSVWLETRCVATSPHNSQTIYAGTHIGLHRSRDGGANFEFVASPFDNMQVWSIAVHPKDPDIVYVGIAPFDTGQTPIWRTKDGGETWSNLNIIMPERNPMNGAVHVTTIVFDPTDSETIYASAEIAGSYRSDDGGETWIWLGPLGASVFDQDNHGLTVTSNGTLFITSPMGVYRSIDRGETFSTYTFPEFKGIDPVALKFGVTGYCRGVTFRPDRPETIYVGAGDTVPGSTGGVMISRDNGNTWKRANLPVEPNSHIYCLATHPSKPERVAAASMYGYLYTSEDGGESWRKHKRELGEIRGLAWIPNAG